MKLSKYAKHISSHNIYNPFSFELKQLASKIPIDKSLLTGKIYRGKSATETDYARHHIYEPNLFPIPQFAGICTPRIVVLRKKHEQLHRLLAGAKDESGFIKYELALIDECPNFCEPTAKIYIDRISQIEPTILMRLLSMLSLG